MDTILQLKEGERITTAFTRAVRTLKIQNYFWSIFAAVLARPKLSVFLNYRRTDNFRPVSVTVSA
jgi:hypothetical protein